MRLNVLAALYMGLALTANPGFADQAALEALREGTLEKLMFSEPVAAPDEPFTDMAGAEVRLSDYRGKVVVVNFWATWCAPCRKEMPSLAALNAELGGEDLAVLPIATGYNALPGIQRFMAEIGVDDLPVMLDPKKALSHQFGVMALPVTVILDREGNEVARLMGDADWNSESAQAILIALMGDGAGG